MTDKALVIPIKRTSQRIQQKNFLTLGSFQLWHIAATKAARLVNERVVQYAGIYCHQSVWDEIEPDVPPGLEHYPEPVELGLPDMDALTMFQTAARTAKQLHPSVEVFASLSCCSPFVKFYSLVRCIASVNLPRESATLVHPIHTRQWRVKSDGSERLYDPHRMPPTQQSSLFIEADILWVRGESVILEDGRNLSDHPALYAVEGVECIDIDRPADYQLARLVYQANPSLINY